MEPLEISLETKEGIVDCRIEAIPDKKDFYDITILYPFSGNGFGRSEIFCHEIFFDEKEHSFLFVNPDNELYPKIKALESLISKALINSLNSK